MADDKQIDTEKYQGPGHLASSFGDAGIYGVGGMVAGTVGGAIGGSFLKESKIASRFEDAFYHVGIDASPRVAAIVGIAAISAVTLATIGAITGSIVGWGKATKGQKQFEALKTKNDQATQELDAMKLQVEGLNREVDGHRKFTDSIKSRTENGHSTAHEAEKTAHEHSGHAL